jgi:hypothetical protein
MSFGPFGNDEGESYRLIKEIDRAEKGKRGKDVEAINI